MIGGARTNGCSEQKAEDGRSFHRSGDGAITFCCGARVWCWHKADVLRPTRRCPVLGVKRTRPQRPP